MRERRGEVKEEEGNAGKGKAKYKKSEGRQKKETKLRLNQRPAADGR